MPPPIRAKHPLAPEQPAIGHIRIIAVEQAVPVQRLLFPTTRTALPLSAAKLLLERRLIADKTKSRVSHGAELLTRKNASVEDFSFERRFADGGTQIRMKWRGLSAALTALSPRSRRNSAQSYEITSARKRRFLRRHCGP